MRIAVRMQVVVVGCCSASVLSWGLAAAAAADAPKKPTDRPAESAAAAQQRSSASSAQAAEAKPSPSRSAANKPEASRLDSNQPNAGQPERNKASEAKKQPPKKNPREYVSGKTWKEPKIVDPGPPGGPPSDALVLFDGKDLTAEFADAEDWIVAGGVATVAGKKSIVSRRPFGSCQLHLEWATPEKVTGTGQGRGNSGVYLMNTYEVQILDSYENTTYYDGQAGAVYKQVPPLVNASRAPGQWQTYDIVFHAPKFGDDGKLLAPATVTVFHNGVLVQDHFELQGGMFSDRAPGDGKHPPKAPLQIQNHGNPMRFRNLWIRELSDAPRS